jgi:hypothetical protein
MTRATMSLKPSAVLNRVTKGRKSGRSWQNRFRLLVVKAASSRSRMAAMGGLSGSMVEVPG